MPIHRFSSPLITRAFQTADFRREFRHWGERKIGLWRKNLRPGVRKKTPRRLVLLPGFGDSPLSWSIVLTLIHPAIRRQFDELVLVELPGFSGALAHEIAFDSFDSLFQSTDELLTSLAPTAVVGHSLGGWLAGHYACGESARATARKRKPTLEELVLIAPSGALPNAKELRTWATLFRRTTKEGLDALRPHLFAKEPKWFPLIAKEFSRFTRKPEVRDFLYSFKARKHRLEPRMGGIQARTWLVWGDSDTLVPTSWSSAWLHHLPETARAELVVLKKTGHSPQIEKPAVLSGVLAQVLLGRRPHPLGNTWYTLEKR